MYSRRQQKMVGRISGLGGVPRRGLLQGAGALGLAAILRPTAAFAECDDEDKRLGPFGPWCTPVNLGPVVNSPSDDFHPAISRNGLSLYVSSTRPGGVNGANPNRIAEIWVSRRAHLDNHWGSPRNLGAVVNSVGSNTAAPNFPPDGHLMFFHSPRLGGCGAADLYVSHRTNKHDDLGWQEPVNLGCAINSPNSDNGPAYFEDEETGIITMYFNSNRPGGPGAVNIYASIMGDDELFGPALLVPELSHQINQGRPAIRRDGLEIFIAANGIGPGSPNDIWVSTREATSDPWSMPVNLGRPVNTEFAEGGPALSWDGAALYFYSDRPGGFGGQDLYVTTREKIRDEGSDDNRDGSRINRSNGR